MERGQAEATGAVDLCTSIVWMGHLIERLINTRLPNDAFPAGMSFARANILFAVHAARQNDTSSRMVDIALDLGVTARTLTPMVDALERQGLIRREPDARDRRALQLVLTSEGEALLGPLSRSIQQSAGVLMAPLSLRQRDQLTRTLTLLIERDGA